MARALTQMTTVTTLHNYQTFAPLPPSMKYYYKTGTEKLWVYGDSIDYYYFHVTHTSILACGY